MVSLALAGKQGEALLYSLLQKYLYEMSGYYGGAMDENGNFAYPYLPYYFSGSDRQAYLIRADGAVAGFALVNTHSFVEPKAEHCLAEFTVFPAFRGRGHAREAMLELLRLRPGSCQLKYSTVNTSGAAFWKKLTAPYGAVEHSLGGSEIAVAFTA